MGEYFSHAAACIIGVQLNDCFLLRKGALKARRLADGEYCIADSFPLCIFTLFDGFICQKEQDMESAYAVIPVTVVVSNLTGTKTDDLKITDYIINYFLSDKYAYGGELQEKHFPPM